jgi:hypothetical protein
MNKTTPYSILFKNNTKEEIYVEYWIKVTNELLKIQRIKILSGEQTIILNEKSIWTVFKDFINIGNFHLLPNIKNDKITLNSIFYKINVENNDETILNTSNVQFSRIVEIIDIV